MCPFSSSAMSPLHLGDINPKCDKLLFEFTLEFPKDSKIRSCHLVHAYEVSSAKNLSRKYFLFINMYGLSIMNFCPDDYKYIAQSGLNISDEFSMFLMYNTDPTRIIYEISETDRHW